MGILSKKDRDEEPHSILHKEWMDEPEKKGILHKEWMDEDE